MRGWLGARRRAPRAGSGAVTLVLDTFTRSAGVIGTANTGQAWTQHAGTAATNGSTVTLTGADAIASVSVGIAAMDVSLDFVDAAQQHGIAVRVVDATNYLVFLQQPASNDVVGYRRVAGAYTQIMAGVAVGAHTGTIRVVASGNSLTVYWNGAQIGTATEATFNTATRAGVFGDAATLDNLLVRTVA